MSQDGLRNFALSDEELGVARALTKQFGTSYFWATLLFPRALRHATFVLYAFFRIPDEYVDRADSQQEAAERLAAWRAAWERSSFDDLALTKEERLMLAATRRVFNAVHMPETYADAFLKAMERDLTVDQYETYADLEGYMYGSAAVVGLMMTELIGYTDSRALHFAKCLGEAMQLTNFLRDVGEDFDERGRIYLPQEDLRRFGVAREDIAQKRVTPAFIELMQFEITRARALYAQAEEGIALLNPAGQRSVRAALVLYRAILNEIERNRYDVLTRRARTTGWQKIMLLAPTLFKK